MVRNMAAFLFVWMGTTMVYAQEGSMNEFGLLLGGHRTPNLMRSTPAGGHIEFKSGVVFQATYARHLVESEDARISLEVPFLAAPTVKAKSANPDVPIQYASLFLTPGLRVTLRPNGAVSPWLSAGGGYALFEQASELQSGAPNLDNALRHTGALQLGAGLDIQTPLRILFPLSIRGEIRNLYSGKPDYNVDTGGARQHNLVISGGFAIRF